MPTNTKNEETVENLAHPLPAGLGLTKRGAIILLVDVVIAALMLMLLPQAGLTTKESAGLTLLVFVGILWLTEAIHVTITSLLVPILAVAFGILTVPKAMAPFADPTIYVFFGGFALATALHIQGIDRAIANGLLHLAGGHLGKTAVMLFIATAALSMWISNTATAAMMLPLTLGILSSLDRDKDRGTFTFLLLGVAFSASIGGLGTLVGSPPNLIAAKALDISFAEWMKFGVPVMLIMLPAMIVILYLVFRPNLSHKIELKEQRPEDRFVWTTSRITTVVIFACTALLWIFSLPISQALGGMEWFSGIASKGKIGGLDTFIAVLAAVAIGVTGVAKWRQIQENTEWGVLLLFGGGLTLTAVLAGSGAGKVLAQGVSAMLGGDGTALIVVIAVVAAFIIILTEFSSNTAAANLLVPLFVIVSAALDMPPHLLTLVIGIGASLAFMLPVATPPNAIVFGTGYIRQKDMIKAGFVLVCFSVCLLTVFGRFIWTLPAFEPSSVSKAAAVQQVEGAAAVPTALPAPAAPAAPTAK